MKMKSSQRSVPGCWYLILLMTMPVAVASHTSTLPSISTTPTAAATSMPTTAMASNSTTAATLTVAATSTTISATTGPFKSLASFDLSRFSLPDPSPVKQTCKKADMCASVPGICNKGTCSTRPCSTEIVCNCDHGRTGLYCDQNINDVIAASNVPMVNGKIITTVATPVKQHVNGHVEPYKIRQKIRGGTDGNGENGNGNGHYPADNGLHENGNNGHSDNGNGHYDNGATVLDDDHAAADSDIVSSHSVETSESTTTAGGTTTSTADTQTTPTIDVVKPTHRSSTTVQTETTTQLHNTPNDHVEMAKSTGSTGETTSAFVRMSGNEKQSTSVKTVINTTSTVDSTLRENNATSTTAIVQSTTDGTTTTTPTATPSTKPTVDGSYRKGPESFIFADNRPLHVETPVQTLKQYNRTQTVVKQSTERMELPRATVKMTYATVFPPNVKSVNTNLVKSSTPVKLKKLAGTIERVDEKIIVTNTTIASQNSGPDLHSERIQKAKVHSVHSTANSTLVEHSTKHTVEVKSQARANTPPSNAVAPMVAVTTGSTTAALVKSETTGVTTDNPKTTSSREKVRSPTTVNSIAKSKEVTATMKLEHKIPVQIADVPDGISLFADKLEQTVRETAALMKVSGTKKMSTSVFSPVIVNFLNIFQSPKFFSVVKSNDRVNQNAGVNGGSGTPQNMKTVVTAATHKHAEPGKATTHPLSTTPMMSVPSTPVSPTAIPALTSQASRTTHIPS